MCCTQGKGKGKVRVRRPGRPAGAKTEAKAAKEGGGAGVHQIKSRGQRAAGAGTDNDMPEDKGASSLVKRKAHVPARSTGGKADGRKKFDLRERHPRRKPLMMSQRTYSRRNPRTIVRPRKMWKKRWRGEG